MSDERIVDRSKEIELFDRWQAEHERRRGAALARHFGDDGDEPNRANVGSALGAVESRARLNADLEFLDRERESIRAAILHAAVAHAHDVGARRARRLVVVEVRDGS